jgi:hypothetical protein
LETKHTDRYHDYALILRASSQNAGSTGTRNNPDIEVVEVVYQLAGSPINHHAIKMYGGVEV